MNSNSSIQRSRIGRLVPGMALVIATAFASLSFMRSNQSSWLMMSPTGRLFVSGCFLAIAAVVELLVMRQWKFVARAVPCEIIIDDVRPLPWSRTHLTVQYHFFTEDRRVVSACFVITDADRAGYSNGTRLKAIYDPIRPARHAIVGRALWAIDWTPESRTDESFDQAVSAMLAIAPRRAA